MVLGADDELAAVRNLDKKNRLIRFTSFEENGLMNLDTVDDERVVVADVPLHVLDALSQLDVVVVPRDRARRQGDDSAR